MITRLTTKELLAESLKELSAHKPIDKITIKEIVQNCGFTAKITLGAIRCPTALNIFWTTKTS